MWHGDCPHGDCPAGLVPSLGHFHAHQRQLVLYVCYLNHNDVWRGTLIYTGRNVASERGAFHSGAPTVSHTVHGKRCTQHSTITEARDSHTQSYTRGKYTHTHTLSLCAQHIYPLLNHIQTRQYNTYTKSATTQYEECNNNTTQRVQQQHNTKSANT